MSNFAQLVAQCPASKAKTFKPFLLKAQEFEGKGQHVVAYYLKTYVAHVGVRDRKSGDGADGKEATQFLMKLLGHLEEEKAKYGTEITESDGRTVVTRTALMCFARADDMERSGEASNGVVQLFFTASLLFQATQQFVESMDPIAAEKNKYARYIAAHMKKALDSGQEYVSPNKNELDDAMAPSAGTAATATAQPPYQQQQQQQPPVQQQYQQQQQPAHFQQAQAQAHQQPPPPNPADNTNGFDWPTLPQHSPTSEAQEQQLNFTVPGQHQYPPPANMEPATTHHQQQPQYQQQQQQQPPPQQYQQQQQAPPMYQPPPQQQQQQQQPQYQQQQQQPQYQQQQPQQQPATPGGSAPDMDRIITAQKLAKQAVSALQFYDHENAKIQLRKALAELERLAP